MKKEINGKIYTKIESAELERLGATELALIAYDVTDPLDIWMFCGYDDVFERHCAYAVTGAAEEDNITFERVNAILEGFIKYEMHAYIYILEIWDDNIGWQRYDHPENTEVEDYINWATDEQSDIWATLNNPGDKIRFNESVIAEYTDLGVDIYNFC